MSEPQSLLSVGTLLRNGTYRIERHLGSGGFGNTYLVRHLGLDAEMVVKEFFMKGVNLRSAGNTVTVSVPDNRATFESQREKFKKEARRLWKLRSEHIVGVHDIFEENATVYYSMDFIRGESLDERLRRQGAAPLPEDEVRDILMQLLDALDAIHGNKPQPIFHLDIKPGNILRQTDGRIVLIDFGASKQLSADRDGVTSMLMTYTKGYAPSEQMDSKAEHIGAWTDLYALGATLYKFLTLNQPPEPSELISEGADAFTFPASVSPQMRQLIEWMMQPSRRQRPQSVAQVREWLRQQTPTDVPVVGTDEVTIVAPEPLLEPSKPQPVVLQHNPVNPTPSPKWKKPAIVAAIAIVVIAAIIGIMLPLGEDTTPADSNLDEVVEVVEEVAEDEAEATKEGVNSRTFTANGVSFKMIRVEGGTFQMGSTDSDDDSDESPVHSVTLSSYYIGETEVTQALWQAVMGRNPSSCKGDNHPVEMVSWNECKTFISKLNSITNQNFRLPTEAEWEYAARGGNKSQHYKYSGSNTLDKVAWYTDNSGGETHPVKTKSPNELSIYDMSGNVWEWCQDWYGSYSSSSQTNPTGPSSGSFCVYRGGSWLSVAGSCRVSRRGSIAPDFRSGDLGLRLAL